MGPEERGERVLLPFPFLLQSIIDPCLMEKGKDSKKRGKGRRGNPLSLPFLFLAWERGRGIRKRRKEERR